MKPQERADRLRTFQRELAELEREGALELTLEQRSRLDAHIERTLSGLASQFDVDTSESQRQISWGMKIASARPAAWATVRTGPAICPRSNG